LRFSSGSDKNNPRPKGRLVQIMLRFVKTPVAATALICAWLVTPALAQSASEMAVRMQQLEEQVRQLTGQVQELSFEVKQLRAQSGGAAAPQQSGAVQQLTPPAATIAGQPEPSQQKRLAAASAGTPIPDSNDIEVIEQQPIGAAPAAQPQTGQSQLATPDLQVLGAMDNAAAQPNDGGFQGKVLVPPSQQEPGDDVLIQQENTAIENVALAPEASGESPESLYERSNESLLRRQFGEAEAGFSNFLQKYPDHSLAGSAQYWLGETFYAQGDFKRAAASFLQGYKKYPKSRRAPDSLLKLGISLNRLGQAEQACAAYAAVNAEYPKAVDARKRAQAESKRAGCAS
jgi:tol-pal system protein YbgF